MTHQVPQFIVSPTPLPGYEQAWVEMMDTSAVEYKELAEAAIEFAEKVEKIKGSLFFSSLVKSFSRQHIITQRDKPKG